MRTKKVYFKCKICDHIIEIHDKRDHISMHRPIFDEKNNLVFNCGYYRVIVDHRDSRSGLEHNVRDLTLYYSEDDDGKKRWRPRLGA